MRLLLDTHAFLWYVWDAPELSATAISLIEDVDNEKCVSIASLWEMAIKVSTGRLALKRPFNDIKSELIDGNGFELLPIEFSHTVTLSTLPFHHKDPFDRLLIAQSLTDNLSLISNESIFDSYGVQRRW